MLHTRRRPIIRSLLMTADCQSNLDLLVVGCKKMYIPRIGANLSRCYRCKTIWF